MKALFSLIVIASFFSIPLQVNTGTVTGTITEKGTGEPLIGASIHIKETKNGTVADLDGAYSLNVEAGEHTLVVTYVGFETQEIKNVKVETGKNTVINVQMDEGSQLLECVTVSSVSSKGKLRRAASSVKNKLRKKSKSSSNKKYAKDAKMTDGLRRNSTPPPSPPPPPPPPTLEEAFIVKEEVNTRHDHSGSEEYTKIVENKFITTSSEALSTFSIDVDNASYSNTRRYLNHGSLPPADAVRTEEMVNYFTYDYPQPEGVDPFAVYTEVSECPWNKENQLVHIGLQGEHLDLRQAPRNNLVFLIDVSGSMNNANKLPLLKKGFEKLVNNLKEDDKVSIVVYAGAAGLVLPPTNDKAKILAALNNLKSGGSTAGGAGINLAYKTAKDNFMADGNNRVILATDGDFNVGVSGVDGLEKLIVEKRKDDIFLTVLGLGMGNYKDNRLETLADKGNGTYAYIDNEKEAEKLFVTEMTSTLYTIAKDVKLQIEFNPRLVESYRLVGYENRMMAKEDFDDDKKDAGELGAGHTVTALYEIVPAGKTKTSKKSELKYQKYVPTVASSTDELLNIKLRYKRPKEDVSKLITSPLTKDRKTLAESSDNFRFSASVAAFSLLLRNSEFVGDLTYHDVLKLAEGAKGKDTHGYRAEFIELVKKAETMTLTTSK